MSCWQHVLLQRLRSHRPAVLVEAYGSGADPTELDGWSDLDVELRLTTSTGAAALFDGDPWAWQETSEGGVQILRLVLRDGRRIDARVLGGRLTLPDPPPDVAVRFDAALAVSRLGRGAELVGLHLLLGILQEALVQQMLLADQAAGVRHHRHATPHDAHARSAAEVLSGSLGPESVLAACDLYGRWRAALDPTYSPDWSGLRAVVERGRQPS